MLNEEQIFDILDGIASDELLRNHEELLTNSTEYRTYYDEIKSFHLQLSDLGFEEPSKEFTQNVLSRLSFVKINHNAWARKWIFAYAASILLSLGAILSLLMGANQEISTSWFSNISTVFLGDSFINTIIIVNLLILLVLIDRKILKPYFKNRRLRIN